MDSVGDTRPEAPLVSMSDPAFEGTAEFELVSCPDRGPSTPFRRMIFIEGCEADGTLVVGFDVITLNGVGLEMSEDDQSGERHLQSAVGSPEQSDTDACIVHKVSQGVVISQSMSKKSTERIARREIENRFPTTVSMVPSIVGPRRTGYL